MSTQIFTDETAHLCTRTVFPSVYAPNFVTVKLSSEPTAAGFYGFGAALTGSSCYLLSQMEPTERTALLRSLYTDEGLNLSVARLTIGASDYSAELYSYDDVPGDTGLEHFSIQRDESYMLPMLREILAIRPDLYLFASPWSPPGWMKTEGSLCGGFMREEYVECFADYIIRYLKAYAAHGIHISALTPQNEPYTDQDGRMPACIWHPETSARFLCVLCKKLRENQLDVKLWMHDHNFSQVNRVLWSLDTIDGLKDCCDGVAFHYYTGSIQQTRVLKDKYPQLELHFTEGGPRLFDRYATDWVKWGAMISKALGCGYRSFTGWNLMLDETGNPNIGPFSCGGLVTRNSITGEITYSGQYKALSHIAPYISPKSRIHAITTDEHDCMSDDPKKNIPVEGFYIQNDAAVSALVLINAAPEKRQVQFCIGGTWNYAELSPNSISTIL